MTEEFVTLDSMSRQELIARAKSLGVERPQVMTRVELKDEILRRTTRDEATRRQVRGWFGVARDLVASVVERGLHLPDAAGVLRGGQTRAATWAPPVATVTLAEIYASQGHRDRAVAMLDEVLSREPEHDVARQLRERLALGVVRHADLDAVAGPVPDSAASRDGEEPSGTRQADACGPAPAASTTLPDQALRGDGEPVRDSEASAPRSDGLVAEAPGLHVSAVMEEWVTALAADAAQEPNDGASCAVGVGRAELAPHSEAEPVSAKEPTVPTPGPNVDESSEQVSAQPLVPSLDVLFWRRAEDGSVALYWELSPESERRHLARDPQGKPVSRLAGAYVEGGSCRRFEREVALEGCFGSTRVEPVPEGAQLRVALGWIGAGRFVPIALGLGIERRAGAGEWWENLVAEPAQQEELNRARQRAAAALG